MRLCGADGDCVARAIAIGTGAVYRDVYSALGEASFKSPRTGVPVHLADEYLRARGWQSHSGYRLPFDSTFLPKESSSRMWASWKAVKVTCVPWWIT